MAVKAKQIRKLSDLVPDNRNANKGTKRGNSVLAKSLKDLGAGRSILIDRNGVIIAGNKTAENAAKAGIKKLQVVQTDGSTIIAVQRIDLDLKKDKGAKALAIADNRAGELNLDWDPAVLREIGKEIDLVPFFSADELPAKDVNFSAQGESEPLNHGFGVMIENITEEQQVVLLEKLTKEGFECRALTF